jgi:hypothetical protein
MKSPWNMSGQASPGGLYATLAVVALLTVLLASAVLRAGPSLRADRRVSFQFDEPAPSSSLSTPAAGARDGGR